MQCNAIRNGNVLMADSFMDLKAYALQAMKHSQDIFEI